MIGDLFFFLLQIYMWKEKIPCSDISPNKHYGNETSQKVNFIKVQEVFPV